MDRLFVARPKRKTKEEVRNKKRGSVAKLAGV